MKSQLTTMKLKSIIIVLTLCWSVMLSGQNLNLNGEWETGIDRQYTSQTMVPGIPTTDTHNPAPGSVWFKKQIQLPEGDWTNVSLVLKSALYRPRVYINGDKVGESIGGMMPISFGLSHKQVKPGNEIVLEIELTSLKDVPEDDPAKPSPADLWRSCQASWIRDDISLIFYNNWQITRLIPFTSESRNSVNIEWGISPDGKDASVPDQVKFDILDATGTVVLTSKVKPKSLAGSVVIPFNDQLKLWSPLDPNLYQLRTQVIHKGKVAHEKVINYAPKTFGVSEDKSKFLLNGNPCTLRGGSIVWNRFAREAVAKDLIDDREWFYEAIIKPFKEHGANLLRFHLYPPPEWMMDLCDEYGLLVQLEAQYFHGMGGSRETLPVYYSKLLTLGAQHPSTALIQLFNETEPELEKIMHDSYLEISSQFPNYLIANSDTYNLHRYWWSMAENVALYANSWKDYDRPTVIDEFGANYMNENWEVSSYPRAEPGFDRFLNVGHTPEMRSKMQEWSYGRIGEYWRRIGIQGIAPFCTLGPFEDGGNWYEGPLEEARLKPLWSSLASVYSPRSVSIEIWDRNFEPNQEVELPLYLFNEYSEGDSVQVELRILNEESAPIWSVRLSHWLDPFAEAVKKVNVSMPAIGGDYVLEAELLNPVGGVKVPVISLWEVNVHEVVVPSVLKSASIGIPDSELELSTVLRDLGLKPGSITNEVDIIVTSHITWDAIYKGDSSVMQQLDGAIRAGKKVVMLDVGPKFHGEKCPTPAPIVGADGTEYPAHIIQKGDTSKNTLLLASQSFSDEFEARREKDIWSGDFPGGVSMSMKYALEPESHFHPSPFGQELWNDLSGKDRTWLWNGLRGGLTVPAIDVFVDDLDQNGYLDFWLKRGADTARIKNGPYYAYELEGYFGFSDTNDDLLVLQDLYKRVHFVVEDLVSLRGLLDPDSDAKIQDISRVYSSLGGKSEKIVPLAIAGYGLNKTPIQMIDFANGGKLIVSNLFTAGRLTKEISGSNLYDYRFDPVCLQFVLNMLAFPLESEESERNSDLN